MEVTAENVQALVTYLTQTLSPEYEVRKPAEDYLMSVEKQAGYSILLLQLTDSEQVDLPVRLAAVINFKNCVKRNWRVLDGENKVCGWRFVGVKVQCVGIKVCGERSGFNV